MTTGNRILQIKNTDGEEQSPLQKYAGISEQVEQVWNQRYAGMKGRARDEEPESDEKDSDIPDSEKATIEAHEVLVYGPIWEEFYREWFGDGCSVVQFRKDFKNAVPKDGAITVRINSPGGYVDEAAAIMQTVEESSLTINMMIDGMAASAASLLACVGDTRGISRLGSVFIHDPWSIAIGPAATMRAEAKMLESIAKEGASLYDEVMDFSKSDDFVI